MTIGVVQVDIARLSLAQGIITFLALQHKCRKAIIVLLSNLEETA